MTADFIANLPASASLYSLLDAAMPDVVGDHVDSGGLSTGEPGRLGGHGSSWTQTMFRVNGADITDPSGGGTPLVVPDLAVWERVEVATGLLPIDVNAPGLAVILTPKRPTKTWTSQLEAFGAPAALHSQRLNAIPPPIARLDTWANGNLLVSGPLVPNRVGLVLAGNYTRSARFERSATTSVNASLGSGFANLVVTPAGGSELQIVGWVQRAVSPYENGDAFAQPQALDGDTSFHTSLSWQERAASDVGWHVFGAFTGRHREPRLASAPTIVVERLADGPVPQLIYGGQGTDRTWSVGANKRFDPVVIAGRPHVWFAGAEATGGYSRAEPAPLQRVGETVNGVPARVWDFGRLQESRWHDTTIAAYVSDTFSPWRRVTLDLALRFEALSGRADGGATGVSWRNWLPRGGIRYDLVPAEHVTAFMDFSRYAYRLPLADLAYGDANAPVANVYRWSGGTLPQPGTPIAGPVVFRVGPGTGGDPNFSAIDPNLARPYMDEITTGFEWRPLPKLRYRLTGIVRREQRLLGVVNTGAPASSYTVQYTPDPGIDLASTKDDQLLPFYNRIPSTYGADRYLLTNPPDDRTTFVGVDIGADMRFGPVEWLAGGTAGRSEGVSASRGFLAVENDQGVLGEAFTNPNAATNSRGRLFTERGYTIKTAIVYHLPYAMTFGVNGRYQDGQHFARMVIDTNLNQGAEAVRAFPDGKTRFNFTMTWDMRLQKAFTVNGHQLALVVDGYNVVNTGEEIEEFTVTGAGPRLTTAIQPPRAIHVGLKVGF